MNVYYFYVILYFSIYKSIYNWICEIVVCYVKLILSIFLNIVNLFVCFYLNYPQTSIHIPLQTISISIYFLYSPLFQTSTQTSLELALNSIYLHRSLYVPHSSPGSLQNEQRHRRHRRHRRYHHRLLQRRANAVRWWRCNRGVLSNSVVEGVRRGEVSAKTGLEHRRRFSSSPNIAEMEVVVLRW